MWLVICIGIGMAWGLYELIQGERKRYRAEQEARQAQELRKQKIEAMKEADKASKDAERAIKAEHKAVIRELEKRCKEDRKRAQYTLSLRIEDDIRRLEILERQITIQDHYLAQNAAKQAEERERLALMQQASKASGGTYTGTNPALIALDEEEVKLLDKRATLIEKQSKIISRLEESGALDAMNKFNEKYAKERGEILAPEESFADWYDDL